MNILLVRLRLIGDVVFTTPVIRALRRQFPSARISYLVEAAAAPVVATNPHLSDVITVTHSRGWQRVVDDLRLSGRLRRAGFDLVIDLHGGPRSAWLTWATRAPRRVGYDVPGRQWMYTQVVHRPRVLRARHSVENQWDLLPAVDSAFPSNPDPAIDRVEMPADPRATRAITNRLRQMGIPDEAHLVVLHVSAGNPFRRWPESSFAELAAGLAMGGPTRYVLVTSGPSDHDAATRVIADARARAGAAHARILDIEALSLAELRATLDRAALFVGGASAPPHIAATSDVPIVGLYGPTLPERSAPWRPRHLKTAAVDAGTLPCRPCEQRACVPGDFRCLTTIAAARVHAAAEALIEGA